MHQTLYILWDASHIWGHMLLHTLQGMGVPFRLVKAYEIAEGLLSGKPPAALIVPGGTARLKAEALGEKGLNAIRAYVNKGGQYIGFCGGAGLGLSDKGGLKLCPWKRATYTDRMQHLVSGHMLVHVADHKLTLKSPLPLAVPIWWPGRFAAENHDNVTILATYHMADSDLQVADIDIAHLPPHIFTEWKEKYGVDMQAHFLQGKPCIITGDYGKGCYVLSYSHLETPESPSANAWFGHLLRTMANISPKNVVSPQWYMGHVSPTGHISYVERGRIKDNAPLTWQNQDDAELLYKAYRGMQHIMELGVEHHLLFRRTPWLFGWRTGIPGTALNNLYIVLCSILRQKPTPKALQFWQKNMDSVAKNLPILLENVENYLLTERLATTLAVPLPQAVNRHKLLEERQYLFGKVMEAGGLYGQLLDIFEELFFLQHDQE